MLSKNNFKFLEELVSLKTISGEQSYQKKAIALVRKNLPTFFKSVSFSKNGIVSELFYPYRSKDSLDIILVAHIDVVAGKPELFKLIRKSNKLYGRGVFDMKGPLVAMVNSINKFYEESKRNISIGILVTSDEEQGGFNGAGFVLSKNNFKAKLAIIPDGGDDLNKLIVEEKGALDVELSYRGTPAHVSKPWEGKNAAENLIKIVNRITSRFSAGNEKQWKTTAALVEIKSEFIANNVIPSSAKARVFFRYIKKDSIYNILKFIKSMDRDLEIRILAQGEALKINYNDNFLKIYRESVKLKTGKMCLVAKYYSTCDARFFASKGMPVIISRPLGGNAHGDNEWISADSLNIFSEVLVDFFDRIEQISK